MNKMNEEIQNIINSYTIKQILGKYHEHVFILLENGDLYVDNTRIFLYKKIKQILHYNNYSSSYIAINALTEDGYLYDISIEAVGDNRRYDITNMGYIGFTSIYKYDVCTYYGIKNGKFNILNCSSSFDNIKLEECNIDGAGEIIDFIIGNSAYIVLDNTGKIFIRKRNSKQLPFYPSNANENTFVQITNVPKIVSIDYQTGTGDPDNKNNDPLAKTEISDNYIIKDNNGNFYVGTARYAFKKIDIDNIKDVILAVDSVLLNDGTMLRINYNSNHNKHKGLNILIPSEIGSIRILKSFSNCFIMDDEENLLEIYISGYTSGNTSEYYLSIHKLLDKNIFTKDKMLKEIDLIKLKYEMISQNSIDNEIKQLKESLYNINSTVKSIDNKVDIIQNRINEKPHPTDIKQISCGNEHTVILYNNNTIKATGNNAHGQLGLGDNADRNAFTEL